MSEQEKMLERVRALLAKAEGSDFPEEAEAFRSKADELMTKYAISQWQIDKAQAGVNARSEPIVRRVNFSWYWNTDSELGGGLWSMYLGVASHCRCSVAHKYAASTIPVIGMEADLDYMDLLFTHLFVQLVSEMDPKPRPGEPLIEALVRMKEAGIKWEECFNRLKLAGHYDADARWNPSKADYAGKYRQYCIDHARPQLKVMPTVYRRSFVSGYVAAVKARLKHQREEQGQSTGSMAIALRDISLIVREKMFEEFPQQAKRSGSVATRDLKHDMASSARGARAGERAEIITNSPRIGRQKELG